MAKSQPARRKPAAAAKPAGKASKVTKTVSKPVAKAATKSASRSASRVLAKQVIETPAKPEVSKVLRGVLESIPDYELHHHLLWACQTSHNVNNGLAEKLLVAGKHVTPYHINTDSEDDVESENDSEELYESDESGDARNDMRRKRRPITIGDDEYTQRRPKCENCKAKFDVVHNEDRDCKWHPGVKLFDEEADWWDGYDSDYKGKLGCVQETDEFDEGLKWSCCGEPGYDEGCKTTKHKAWIHITESAKIRIQEKQRLLPETPWLAMCKRCKRVVDSNDNEGKDCVRHPGRKEADYDGDFWADHDEDCHGMIEDLIDDPDCQDGFSWTCCGETGDSTGCRRVRHSPDLDF